MMIDLAKFKEAIDLKPILSRAVQVANEEVSGMKNVKIFRGRENEQKESVEVKFWSDLKVILIDFRWIEDRYKGDQISWLSIEYNLSHPEKNGVYANATFEKSIEACKRLGKLLKSVKV